MIVRTYSGSTYDLDFDAMTVIRVRNEHGGRNMRRDDDAIELLDVELPITVGLSMTMLLDVRRDGVVTVRETSPVTEILI